MWSKFKKALKKIWRAVKAVVRAVVRVVIAVITVILTLPIAAWDLAAGYLGWPGKKMKVHISVLSDHGNPLISYDALEAALRPSIDLLKKAYKDQCNVTVSAYSSGNEREIDNWAQILTDEPPPSALDGGVCGVVNQLDEHETGDAGEYFRSHTAGSVSGIPTSLAFPITVYIVRSIGGQEPGFLGCTIPFLTDYVCVTVDALKKEPAVIAHEIGHRCLILPEHDDQRNLMFSGNAPNLPPHELKGWQTWFVRNSRHTSYLA